MSKKTNDAISRSDRVFVAAMAIILATASAAIGASLTYHPAAAKPAVLPAVTHTVVTADIRPAADTVMTQLLAEHKCLSEVLYYEARGEGAGGQKAVAEVVFHRMNHGNYGHSICAVVYEGAGKRGCQFSFACDGSLKRPREAAAWERSEQLAAQILTREVALRNTTSGATHYHAVYVRPDWAQSLEQTAHIGRHIFYRGNRKS
jgi:hypothetical protein